MNKKSFGWKCPKCEKEIHSFNESQFLYNKEQHIKKHQRDEKLTGGNK